jgi:hypothetical protein
MPAVLIIVNNGNSDRGDGGRWRAGEAILARTDHQWGWKELPKRSIGQQTVAAVNAVNLSNQAPYATVEMADSGTITEGLDGPLEVSAGDAIVLQFTETKKYWSNFGPRPAAEYDEKLNFHWRVSDKTIAEVDNYMESLHKVLDMTVINGPDANGLRRIRIDNGSVTASGENGFTQEGVDDFIEEWNDRYPECGLVQFGATAPAEVTVDGTFTTGQAQEFQEVVVQFGLNDMYTRRRWYINSQGMTALSNNAGFMNTTAQELGQVFRDGLLD